MHHCIISDEAFHCGLLPELVGVVQTDGAFMSTWRGDHPRFGRVVATCGAGAEVVVVSHRPMWGTTDAKPGEVVEADW